MPRAGSSGDQLQAGLLTDVQLFVWLGLAVASIVRLPASLAGFPFKRT